MSVPGDHLDDDMLSSLLDDQITPSERLAAEAHLSTCAECEARIEEFRSVVALVRALPPLDLPRDFTLGPRLLVDPPNVVRLRRWYTATRAAAGALAAIFVFLAAGTLYVDSRPAPVATQGSAAARPAVVPQPAAGLSAPATPTLRSAAGSAPAAAQRAPLNPQADDQVAAATSVSPLPTQVPTPMPTAVPVPQTSPALVVPDSAAPLRTSAAIAGLLAVLTLLAALIVRHRLTQT